MANETILVVDDEETIRETIERQLKKRGYKVILAKDGGEAISLLAISLFEKIPFDLVITDLIMGEINGVSVMKKAKEINSKLPVLVITGFKFNACCDEALTLNPCDCLEKPFSRETLYMTILKCLNQLGP